jgi:hypothetical protein
MKITVVALAVALLFSWKASAECFGAANPAECEAMFSIANQAAMSKCPNGFHCKVFDCSSFGKLTSKQNARIFGISAILKYCSSNSLAPGIIAFKDRKVKYFGMVDHDIPVWTIEDAPQ